MAAGQTHEISNDKVSVIFTEDATYKLVLTSITNLEDGSTITFPAGPLFRVVLRTVAGTDTFTTKESTNATTYAVVGTGYDPQLFHYGSTLENPQLGARNYFQANFMFDNCVGTDDLRVHFTCSLLDSQPDRPLFALYFDTANYGSGLGSSAIFWCAPILLRLTPYASAHYMIGVGGGITSRNPNVDLVGNGGTYQFVVGRLPGITNPASEHASAVGFEPETKAAQMANRMETLYPTWMGTAIAAYGDRSTAGTTIYAHDDLHFHARRFLDYYQGGNILLEHEGLVENGITAGNGWGAVGDGNLRSVKTYVRVFKRLGDVLGEDVGLDYRRWALSSAEGRAILPAKPKDRSDNFPELGGFPFLRTYFPYDDEWENGVTKLIGAENRATFPAIADDDMYRMNYDLSFARFQDEDATANHPGFVGNTMSDLFDLDIDQAKIDYAEHLDDVDGLYTIIFSTPRRPTPYDGDDFWTSDAMDAARIQNHLEAANPGTYKTTDQWLKVTRTVASTSYNGVYTKVTLSAGALDPSLWNQFTTYDKTTAGINHATHSQHLGWLRRSTGSYAFPVERQVQADFIANPPILYIYGSWLGTILAGHTVEFFSMEHTFIPGYDTGTAGQVGDNAPTSLCAMADEAGQGLATPAAGWWFRFVTQFLAKCRPWASGLCSILTRLHPVCWGTHGGHAPGDNSQILAWRRCLAYMRAQVQPEFMLWEEDGPYDWAIGLLDGHTRPVRRLDMTNSVGSWGVSPFFQTAWGAFYRFGGFQGALEGHMSNWGGTAIYDAVFEGPSLTARYREALAGDFVIGVLPTFGVSPDPTHTMGTTPDGKVAYTPFNHATLGITNSESFASLFARLVQFSLAFDRVNLHGQRVRSLLRLETTTVIYNPVSSGFGHEDFHSIGVDESGTQRAPIMHVAWRDHRNPRRIIALFINDYTARRGSSYRFDPSLYADLIPLWQQGFKVTKHTIGPQEVTEEDLGFFTAEHNTLPLSLGPAEVEAYTFDFGAGLLFRYGYDDEPLRDVPIPSDQTRVRVEDIHGAGTKLMVGFKDDLPDQDFKIASMDLRVFRQGQSEAK